MSWMAVAWSLVVECAGYWIFPWIMKHPKYLFLFSLMMTIYLPPLFVGRSSEFDAFHYFSICTRVWEFVLAASFTKLVLDQIIRLPDEFSSYWVDLPPLVAILTMLILPLIPYVYSPEAIRYLTNGWAAPFSLFFIYCLTSDKSRVGRLLSHPIMIWAGDISFAAYILHMPVVLLLQLTDYYQSDLFWIVDIVVFVLIGIISHLVHHYFELPISRYLNSHWSTKCECGHVNELAAIVSDSK